MPLLPRQLNSSAFDSQRAPRSGPSVPPRVTRVCLECASPFSRCPVYHAPTSVATSDGLGVVVTDVATCWCLQCEHIADAAASAVGVGATRASAMRETHDAVELERLIFESAAVHGNWLTGKKMSDDEARSTDWSSARVPVLFLRRFLMVDSQFADDEMWTNPGHRCPAETPRWLVKIRQRVTEMRPLLDVVLAPFTTTLLHVMTNDVQHILVGRRLEVASRYHVEYPDAVVHEPTRHLIARAMFLRIIVAYDLMALFNGENWDFNRVDPGVPYLTNTRLQVLAYQAQLFADTHLDMNVACETMAGVSAKTGFGAYSDAFMASSLADTGDARNEYSPYASSNAAPVALTMCMYARFYPHPVRAPFAGEMSTLGSPLYSTNSQAEVSLASAAVASAKSSAAAAAAAASSASTSSASSQSMLNAVTRFIFLKPLNYRAMQRSYQNIGARYMRNYPAILQWHLNAIECSQYGNFGEGPRLRPRWLARCVTRRTFQFDNCKFEKWCANCATTGKKSSKVFIRGNACPHCKPVQKALWCTNECLSGEFADIHKVLEDETLAAADDAHLAGESVAPTEEGTETATRAIPKSGIGARRHAQYVSDAERAAAFKRSIAFNELRSSDAAEGCKYCAQEQARRERVGLPPFGLDDMLLYHFRSSHVCDFCKEREHDDALSMREENGKKHKAKQVAAEKARRRKEAKRKRRESGVDFDEEEEEEEEEDELSGEEDDEEGDIDAFSEFRVTENGKKPLSSSHVCVPCKLIRDNDRYCFYALKEMLAFMIEATGIIEDMHVRTRTWEPYKRILSSGMDSVRSLVDNHFALQLRTPNVSIPPYVAQKVRRENIWLTIREHIHLVHRCSQPTVSTMRKGSFMKLLRESMASWKAKHYLNRDLTRPQRALDMLLNPEVVLECAGEEKVAADPSIRTAYESLVHWKETRGFCADDVRRCAELSAEMAMNHTEDKKCPVFFSGLRICGMTKFGCSLVQAACYEHEVCRMPDHRLETDCVRRVAENNRADFYILQYFCEIYLLREPIRIFPLSIQAARAQVVALRQRYRVLPYEYLPEDIDVRYVCLGCSRWYAPIVSPVQWREGKEIPEIIFKADGDAARMSKEMFALGHSDLKHDLETGELMCSRDYKAASLSKKFKSYGMLDIDMSLKRNRNANEQVEVKASTIRKIRERGSLCSTQPLTAIALTGVMVRIRGAMYTLCGVCGSLFVVTESKPFIDGIPNCGRHVMFGDATTYSSLRAFRSPFSATARNGDWLQFGHQMLTSEQTQGVDVLSFNANFHIPRCVQPLQFEYAYPFIGVGAIVPNARGGLAQIAALAGEGWVRVSPVLSYAKGVVEQMAMATIQTGVPSFACGPDGFRRALPPAALVPDEAELEVMLASNTINFKDADGRIRRETSGASREHSLATDIIFQQSIGNLHQNASVNDDSGCFPSVLPPSTIRLRGEIREEMLLRCGSIENSVIILCAYCCKVCDKDGQFVRMEVYDVDRLCRNRYTRQLLLDRNPATPAKIEIFLCAKHFQQMRPLLCHFPIPTSAMVFTWLLYFPRNPSNLEKNRFATKLGNSSRADALADPAEPQKAAAASSIKDVIANPIKRARVPTVPKNTGGFVAMPPRRGRPPGSGRGGARGASGRRRGGLSAPAPIVQRGE